MPRDLSSLAAAALMMLAVAPAGGSVAETADRIVAIVNDDAITAADVVMRAQALTLEQGQHPAPGAAIPEDVLSGVLQRVIEQQLMLQEGRRLQVTAGSEEVAAEFRQIRGQSGSDEEFRRSLAEAGLTEAQLKEEIRRQIIIERVIEQEVRSTISMTPQEIASTAVAAPPSAETGPEQVRLSHLLVRTGQGRSEEEAAALIEEIVQRLSAGEPFADLATRHSEDSYAHLGGMMDWVHASDLLPELAAALATLKPGERSQPIRTRLGVHLLQVEARRAAPRQPISEARERAYRQLYERKFKEAFTRWLDGLKQRAYIEILRGA